MIMMKAVYKITNRINGKIYIGVSKEPERRWGEHCYKTERSVSLINQAIKKYGKENFSFEIIEWTESWADKEIYYISFYKSKTPNGYNIHDGGGEPPHYCGEENSFAKINSETARRIQEQLANWSILLKDIVKTNNVSRDIVRHINDGTAWKRKDLAYPIRPTEKELNDMRADKVIELLLTTNLSQKEIAKMVGWSRSTITMINIGANHFKQNIEYPIRK